MIPSCIRIPGGKGKPKTNEWIISKIQPCDIFLDACMGSFVVGLNVKNAQQRIGMDTDVRKIQLFNYISTYNNDYFHTKLINEINFIIKYINNDLNKAKEIFLAADDKKSPLEFLIRNKFSRDGMCQYFSNSDRLRRGIPEVINGLAASARAIENMWEALNECSFVCDSLFISDVFQVVIYHSYNCVYIDPPYLHTERTSNNLYGDHEWSVDDHIKLLQLIKTAKCQILISGYESDLYDQILLGEYGWTKELFPQINSMGGKTKAKRFEALYFNR